MTIVWPFVRRSTHEALAKQQWHDEMRIKELEFTIVHHENLIDRQQREIVARGDAYRALKLQMTNDERAIRSRRPRRTA